ncbi:MAG: transglycosylase domain-containing protein, partial [Gammaproteobacteria bacterium]
MSVWRTYAWRTAIGAITFAGFTCLVLWRVTINALEPVPESFSAVASHVTRVQVLDRHGTPLNTTYANDWNLHDALPLHEVPPFLIRAFVEAEDKRFFVHAGQDGIARMSALGQNLAAMRTVRGASTISEQVVRMIRPRPRTVWSRWLEGWEAERLERAYSK